MRALAAGLGGALLLAVAPASLATGTEQGGGGVSTSLPAAVAGEWTGVGRDRGPHYTIRVPFDLAITRDGTGWSLRDRDRMRGPAAAILLAVSGRSFTARYQGLWPSSILLEGTWSADGRSLAITMRGDGMTGLETHTALLHRGDAAARAFAAPRLDAQGRPQATYSYREPSARADGLAVATPEDVGLARAPLEAMVREILAERGEPLAHHTESMLVLRHGRLVLEEYFWGQDAANPHIISSATKSITSIAVGMAVDDGKLDPARPVASYFADRPDTAWVRGAYPATLGQILAMESGTDFDHASGAPNSGGLLTTQDVVGFALNVPGVRLPGTLFRYDNSLPSLAGPMAGRAEGMPYAKLVESRLFAPLGIVNYRWTMLPEGQALAAGGLYLRPRDMAKIGEMMLEHGRWHGRGIISPQWVDASTRRQTAPGQYAYGYYWHLNDATSRHVAAWDGFMAIGQGGQLILVFPARDMVVVTTSADWAASMPEAEKAMPFSMISDFVEKSVH